MRKPVAFTHLANDRWLNALLVRAAARVIRSGIYLNGPEVRRFEADFQRRYFPGFDAVAVGNGFNALQIALLSHHIGPGKSVIVPTLSPLPVWMAVTAVGAKIIPADCHPTKWVLTEDSLPFVPYADAIIVVHLFGYPANVPAIVDKAHTMYGKVPIIIEDCCQAHGSKAGNSYCGSDGHIAAFSFYPTKNIGGLGDGGMVVTASPTVASRCREIANYGGGETAGINSRMDEIQAAFLSTKLPFLDKWNKKRRENARRYLQRLKKVSTISLPEDHSGHSWHQFVINTRHRDALMRYLGENGVKTMVHYYTYAPDMPFYGKTTNQTVYMSNTSLSLPIAPHVTIADVDFVCDLIERFDRHISLRYNNNANNKKSSRPWRHIETDN